MIHLRKYISRWKVEHFHLRKFISQWKADHFRLRKYISPWEMEDFHLPKAISRWKLVHIHREKYNFPVGNGIHRTEEGDLPLQEGPLPFGNDDFPMEVI